MTPTTKNDHVIAPSATMTGSAQELAGRVARALRRPVLAIQVLPMGGRFVLDSFGLANGHRYMMIGSSPKCDLRIDDDSVSRFHCAITRRQSRVIVHDMGSKNGVKIGGHRLTSCELHDGTVFTIGRIAIAAIGEDSMEQQPMIAASTVHEFLRKAVELHGSKRAAAERIGLPESTLRSWLSKKD